MLKSSIHENMENNSITKSMLGISEGILPSKLASNDGSPFEAKNSDEEDQFDDFNLEDWSVDENLEIKTPNFDSPDKHTALTMQTFKT